MQETQWAERKVSPQDLKTWSQMNGHDCGVFACVFARQLSENSQEDVQPTVNQLQVTQFWRPLIAIECYVGEISAGV
jgi:hypothetical protein